MSESKHSYSMDESNVASIKVIGVGGGGSNAVNRMVESGVQGVTFIAINTDNQALARNKAEIKIQIGEKVTRGLGCGADPSVGEKAAEESRDEIAEAISNTDMLFITAGMGGGTGTGASATIAEVAQEMDILTVGIVTIPFAFEGKRKIRKALTGVAKLAEHVDAILIINNEKLKQIYKDLDAFNAFSKSDDVVGNAAKSIAEIITIPGYINTDFADVYNTLKNGKVAIMNVGQAQGENRITTAIDNALTSPLVNANDVHGAQRVLLQFYCSKDYPIIMQEFDQINQFVDEVGDDVEVQWGVSIDDSLGEAVRVTIIATGYAVSDIPSLEDEAGKVTVEDAMAYNYDGLTPKEDPKPDEKPVEVDLTPTDPKPVEQQIPRRPDFEDGDIIIDFEDEEDSNKEDKPEDTGFFGWKRRR